MRELELLLQNFQITGAEGIKRKGKGKKSQQQPGDRALTPSVVLETLRHTLTDYQRRLDHTTQEVMLKHFFLFFPNVTNHGTMYLQLLLHVSKACK